jgi:hypothetical protein
MKTEVINIKIYKGNDFVYIGRGTPFGNANSSRENSNSRDSACDGYEYDFRQKIKYDPSFKLQVLSLYGKKLGCSCVPLRCHGETIKKYLDQIIDINIEKEKTISLIKKMNANSNIEDILNFNKK